ncbi:hypothetical protein ISN45_At02g040800 [Arabidopsis thaliana x Arabidopsis arenosa]|uniref:Uncharacterized protein n=2 Tax=Arabidopsis TaxID=3701 RepID=A0A8T2G6U1_ARASU|nr:hypothetical protein ISN45_At02g040800 [Arabidopsis thaliana x Arabidopsis arenosa]KAG7644392.1 hypothetical protein ISN44_As02g040920 [Arabidopsis suecica]
MRKQLRLGKRRALDDAPTHVHVSERERRKVPLRGDE